MINCVIIYITLGNYLQLTNWFDEEKKTAYYELTINGVNLQIVNTVLSAWSWQIGTIDTVTIPHFKLCMVMNDIKALINKHTIKSHNQEFCQ